jgi:F-type H+-transporting ATPase subunit a
MTERILAEGAIEVGHHTTATWLGMTVNTDTVLATAIAAAITIGLAFFLRAKVTSTGVPGGVQLFWEAITIQMRSQIEGAIGMKIAPFVLPLAVTLFVFILICNWIAVLPVQYGTADGGTHELLKPPASDINFDAKVDGADLGQLLADWGDAPRKDVPPSDCPLALINP